MRSTGANSWVVLFPFRVFFNMGKRVFSFLAPFWVIFLWSYNIWFNLIQSSSIIHVVPVCDHVNRADFRWNANVQDKLGVQRVDDYPRRIYWIAAFRFPSNCILYALMLLKLGDHDMYSKVFRLLFSSLYFGSSNFVPFIILHAISQNKDLWFNNLYKGFQDTGLTLYSYKKLSQTRIL